MRVRVKVPRTASSFVVGHRVDLLTQGVIGVQLEHLKRLPVTSTRLGVTPTLWQRFAAVVATPVSAFATTDS